MPNRRQVALILVAVMLVAGGAAFYRLRGGTQPGAAPVAQKPRMRSDVPLWASDPDAPRGAIEGVVRDADGKPVDGALVAALPSIDLEDREEAVELRPAATVSTAGGGKYRLESLRPGEYGVTATAVGWTPAHKGDLSLLPGETLRGVDLALGKGGVTLSGRVIDSGGGPIPGAQIRALSTDGGRRGKSMDSTTMVAAAADGQGDYKLTLPRGAYALTADADGYARDSTWVQLTADQSHDFRLNAAARISGLVVERGSGAPVPDALVHVAQQGGWWFEPREVKTDTAGKWEVRDLDPGSYEVDARKGALIGRLPSVVSVALATSVSDLKIELDPGRSISGRVLAPGGAGMASAKVKLGDHRWGGGRVRATSAQNGAYKIEGLLPGKFRVTAEAESHAPASKEAVVTAADVTGLDLTMVAESVVSGRVLDKTGAPVEGANVTAWVMPAAGFWGAGGGSGVDRSKADGAFKIGGLGVGKLQVNVRHADKGQGHHGPDPLAAGETKEITIRLDTGATIAGKVSWDDGTPAVGVTVMGLQMAMGRMPAQAMTGPDGSYRVGPFDKGQVMVAASRKSDLMRMMMGGGAKDRRSVEVEADEQKAGIDLVLDRALHKISGVVLAPDGKPFGGASVGATPEMAGRNMRAFAKIPGDDKNVSGEDGSFTIDDLTKGTYTVWAQAPELPEAQAYPIAAGASGVRLQLKAPASIAGLAVGAGGKPVADYTAVATTARTAGETDDQRMSRKWGGAIATSIVHDPTGAFELKGLTDGVYDVTVTVADGTGGRLAGVTVASGEQKKGLRVTVADGARVTGKVVDLETGAPLPGVQVGVMNGVMDFGETGVSDAAGAFALAGFVPGRTSQVFARGDLQTYVGERREVTVPEGKTALDIGAIKLLKGNEIKTVDQGFPGIFPGDIEGRPIVDSVRPGSSAIEAGVKVGDFITSVDGRDVAGYGPGAITYLLGGKVGSSVSVGLESGGQKRTVALTRISLR